MDMDKLREFINKKPMIAYPAIALTALIVWGLIMMPLGVQEKPAKIINAPKNDSIGISVGGVDQQAYLARLEKSYYDFEERVKVVEDQLKGMKKIGQDIKKEQKEINKSIASVEEKLLSKIEEGLVGVEQRGSLAQVDIQSMELAVADIKSDPDSNESSAYLPIGSFCKGTLMTGVYAAADVNNPLPVLISLDEAFYGPNKTRIPLKNAFVLGKAYGDINSQRALIQIVAISTVLPNGHTFEREENLGYVTDQYGELGIKGKIIHNTGKELALSFMGGFASGGAQAIADGEVSTSRDSNGTLNRDVTGSPMKSAIFSGLSKSTGRMSEYYEKQAENLVPAVHISNGAVVYFVVQKGVSIDGLSGNASINTLGDS